MFSRKTTQFLKELADNNNRDWFAQNKQRYEDAVRTPALDYIENMSDAMYRITPNFVVSAKKVGGSLMRVHRDTRFGKDKTPYKTNVGIQFRHIRGKDVHAPGFYFHIEPKEVFVAGGIWKPESSTLSAVRMMIDEHPAEWKKLVKKLTEKGHYALHGDSLKRPPKGFDKDHPLIEDLKRKDFMAFQTIRISSILGDRSVPETTRLFKAAAPLVKFICEADDLEF